MSAAWVAILATSLGCYLLKLAGVSVPQRWLAAPRVERTANLLPVALLAALVAVQTLVSRQDVTLDARVLGVAAACVALALRAPFLVVVGVAAATAALVRLAAS